MQPHPAIRLQEWSSPTAAEATGSAIATVGSAAANELLAMKADATASAIAANDPYLCLIDEFHDLIIRELQVPIGGDIRGIE